MPPRFPPSSPVAGVSIQGQGSISGDPSFEYIDSKSYHAISPISTGNRKLYPTPFPSSSVGHTDLSSPIRRRKEKTPEHRPINNKSYNEKNLIPLMLDPTDTSRLAIGRKHSVCQFLLPSKRNISRQHAFISYIAKGNQIQLECNGTNSIVIILPSKLKCNLVKPSPSKKIFKIAESHDDTVIEGNSKLKAARSQELSSFVLLKGETVIIPFIEGTIIDFRQAQVVLQLKDITHRGDVDKQDYYLNDEYATETEDELSKLSINSDDFHSKGMMTPEKKLVPVMVDSPRTEKLTVSISKESSPIKFKRPSIDLITTPFTNRLSSHLLEPTTPVKNINFNYRNSIERTPIRRNVPDEDCSIEKLHTFILNSVPISAKNESHANKCSTDKLLEFALKRRTISHSSSLPQDIDRNKNNIIKSDDKSEKVRDEKTTSKEDELSHVPIVEVTTVSFADNIEDITHDDIVHEKTSLFVGTDSKQENFNNEKINLSKKRAIEEDQVSNRIKKSRSVVNFEDVSSDHNTGETATVSEKEVDLDILGSLRSQGIQYQELQYILSNHLAFTNVQQVPLSQLRMTNSKIEELTFDELRTILKDEKSIGVIEREGKDAAGKPLEEEYYYDMENDPDLNRKKLIISLKGGNGRIRSCRKKHKQYFWKRPTKR
ncbi:Plm2p NDAI_0F04330 [Naumovozyma dairenensis CBS 421]|uniref:FHA domain-containing protein n=1 Tax=Naumovozyma dairenensis (strain ATCC 10597 / BCRC 20456 / CBS 421 / NBRC 0211 / NRRL Y-12639) TaxID=1071378 RepID=G0WD90_NAUDC|nr:hypothetical protein NDAI_0F04330 [Naumovozyma dairenensis CBS 421]CCD25751.1 hypothetical protein NDAI_0F04330 [Naumovozyma dairenensis CBS 421]